MRQGSASEWYKPAMAEERVPLLLRLGWRAHRWLYRMSGGRLGRRMNGFPVLLLETRGRRSGELRRAALQYLDDGASRVVIGSRAGDTRHPNWWLNLVADPVATIRIGSRIQRVRARETLGAERDRLWRRFAEIYPRYDEYERNTQRRIPVVVLELSGAGSA
jgi:deazaflavin-dependent oxidoreductase (nitroreductase family)